MSIEIEKGKKLLKIAIPFAWGFSIFLLLGGIGSIIRIFLNGVEFTRTIWVDGMGQVQSWSYEKTINSIMGVILIVVILLVQPIPTTAIQIRRANSLLSEQGHSYEQIVVGLKVFAKKGSHAMNRCNPYASLWGVRINIFTFAIISTFLAFLCCLAIFTSLYSNELLFQENSYLLLAVCLLNIFNPGHIMALVSYQYLYGNEIKRKKV